MIKSVPFLMPFVLAFTISTLDASLPNQGDLLLPEHGRLVTVKDKDNVNNTAKLVIEGDDGKRVELDCQYMPHWEKELPWQYDEAAKDWPKTFPVLRVDEYSSPRAPIGDNFARGFNFTHRLCRKSYLILPTPFLEDDEVAKDLEGTFAYFGDMRYYPEFPISPVLDTFDFAGKSGNFYDYMQSEDIDRLARFLNRCSEDSNAGYVLDDSILVLCRIFVEHNGVYAPATAGGQYFGVYEMSRDEYKALCNIRTQNLAEINGVLEEAAPVILFNIDGTSFKIADQSQLEPTTVKPGCYSLKPAQEVVESQFELDFDYLEDLFDQSQIELDVDYVCNPIKKDQGLFSPLFRVWRFVNDSFAAIWAS